MTARDRTVLAVLGVVAGAAGAAAYALTRRVLT